MSISFTSTILKKNKGATITVTSTTSLTGTAPKSVKYKKKNKTKTVDWPIGGYVVNFPATTATIIITSAKDDEEYDKDDQVKKDEFDPPTTGDLTVDLIDSDHPDDKVTQQINLVS